MSRDRSADPPALAPPAVSHQPESWLPGALTERLLDVLLDTPGVRAAFIVNDFGELLAVRFAPELPRSRGFAAALEAAAGLRTAASSGLEPPTVLVEFPHGLLFARRFRRSYLCVWTTLALQHRALEMSSRLVAASLPPDARMEAAAAPTWDEDDQRPTEPWLPRGEEWPAQPSPVSLRAPRVPRELVDTERHAPVSAEPQRSIHDSGIRAIAPEPPLGERRARRR